MRIYLDVCCLSRPFDDLSQDRIHLEAEAILSIISRCENMGWILLSSGVIDFEILRVPNIEKYGSVSELYTVAKEHHSLSQNMIDRAKELHHFGIKHLDSLHIAIAESAKVDVFLTTDDKLVNAAKRANIGILVANPVTWLMEVDYND